MIRDIQKDLLKIKNQQTLNIQILLPNIRQESAAICKNANLADITELSNYQYFPNLPIKEFM